MLNFLLLLDLVFLGMYAVLLLRQKQTGVAGNFFLKYHMHSSERVANYFFRPLGLMCYIVCKIDIQKIIKTLKAWWSSWLNRQCLVYYHISHKTKNVLQNIKIQYNSLVTVSYDMNSNTASYQYKSNSALLVINVTHIRSFSRNCPKRFQERLLHIIY